MRLVTRLFDLAMTALVIVRLIWLPHSTFGIYTAYFIMFVAGFVLSGRLAARLMRGTFRIVRAGSTLPPRKLYVPTTVIRLGNPSSKEEE